MDAITMGDAITGEDTAQIDIERCIGCGLCVTDCPDDAMTLRQKGETETYVPPSNLIKTYINIAKEKGKI